MNFIYRRQEYGFTLFESVCVIFLFSLLAIVLFQSLTVVCLPIRYSQKKSQLRYEARYLRQFIIHEFSLLYFSPSGDLNAVNSCIVKNITIDKSGAEIKFNYMSPRFAQVKSQLETNTIVVYGIHPWFQRDTQYLLEDGSQCEMAYLQSSRKSQAKYQQTVVFNSPIKLSEKKIVYIAALKHDRLYFNNGNLYFQPMLGKSESLANNVLAFSIAHPKHSLFVVNFDLGNLQQTLTYHVSFKIKYSY